jgi:hypothetical protein
MLIDRSKFFLRTALLALAVPVIGLPANVTLTGPTVNFNGTAGPTSFNQTVSFGNGDVFDVTGTFSAAYNSGGTSLSINPIVTYVGSAPSVGNDSISISYTQPYFNSSPGSWDGTYTETIPVVPIGAVGAGSSISGQLSYNGQGLGVLTGSSGVLTKSANLTGLTTDTLTADFELTYNLNAGTDPGAGISSPASSAVPEPTEALPVGVGLAGVMYAVARRRKKTA